MKGIPEYRPVQSIATSGSKQCKDHSARRAHQYKMWGWASI